MSEIKIVPVKGLNAFLDFCKVPRLIYKGRKGFSPPLDAERWTLYTVNGGGVDDYNDIRQPDNIRITTAALHCAPGEAALTLAPHSVNVLVSHAG